LGTLIGAGLNGLSYPRLTSPAGSYHRFLFAMERLECPVPSAFSARADQRVKIGWHDENPTLWTLFAYLFSVN
jgi:hypothetical protein